ncbi:flavodoxin-dependent (E)-4-hydroxy-3-methylbut-2-enyl-diphosphate synthase [Streptomyces klenkii]|uniref:flavodoxin-dependent (E)-4-hydroxy-3-methylbut-2-enyl-diphosphate synthase n=1 Tax=Streptomyces klenkii TaxID=1420899 RepID=UPI003F4D01B3
MSAVDLAGVGGPVGLRAVPAGDLPRPAGEIQAFSMLLSEGIGDTIRFSISDTPVEQVKAGGHIPQCPGLRPRRLEIVSCPGCGRLQVDLHTLAARVEAAFEGFPHPLRIAVTGCVVNVPGETREADVGVSCGNGNTEIFVRGRVVATVSEARIVDRLIEEALRLAEEDRAQAKGLGRR